MEAAPALPLELWHAICTVASTELPYLDPAAYYIMARAAERFTIPNAKALFIRVLEHKTYTETVLPNGRRHSINGDPAYVDSSEQRWYEDGWIHRTGAPAINKADGSQTWVVSGRLRTGLPYHIGADGTQLFSTDGFTMHMDVPVVAVKLMLIDPRGSYQRSDDNFMHRDILPAIIQYNGTMTWYQNGYKERGGGLPIRIDRNGDQQWWGPRGDFESQAVYQKAQFARWLDEWHASEMFMELTAADLA